MKFTGLKWLHSPSWTINLYACDRVKFDGLYVHTSLKEGVWADGIDIDGCKDVTITNCTIETGDDCIVFISEKSGAPRAGARTSKSPIAGCPQPRPGSSSAKVTTPASARCA